MLEFIFSTSFPLWFSHFPPNSRRLCVCLSGFSFSSPFVTAFFFGGVARGGRGWAFGSTIDCNLSLSNCRRHKTKGSAEKKNTQSGRVKVAESVTATHCRWTFAESAGNPLKCSGNLISISIWFWFGQRTGASWLKFMQMRNSFSLANEKGFSFASWYFMNYFPVIAS